MSDRWQWEEHKPRVWRMYGIRCRVTVCPSLERREFLWVVDRINGVGHTSERARGRCERHFDARDIGESAMRAIDDLEVERNRRAYNAP